jgi:hypothetical protein
MCTRSIAIVTFLAFSLTASVVFAQCGCGAATSYVPTTTYYAPQAYTSYYAPTTAYYAPEAYTSYYVPTTTYYAPETYTSYYAPTTAYYAPSVYTSYYTPTTAYYTPYVAYAPVAGAVVAPYSRVGASVYGTPKVYVRGEPVRNAWRALTP